MKYLNIFFFLILFINFSPLKAEDKTVYLDVDFIIKNSELGKSIILKLDKQNEINIKKLNSTEKLLKKKNDDLMKIKNILSEEEFNNKINELKKDITAFNNERQLLSKNLANTKKEEIKNFFKIINPIIEKYMSENSISLIIDKKNIFIAKSNYDITKKILELINTNN